MTDREQIIWDTLNGPQCVLIGSRAYGINGPDADWDFATDDHTYNLLRKAIMDLNPSNFNGDQAYENACYFQLDGKTINLMCVAWERREIWKLIVQTIRTLCQDDTMRGRFMDKNFRVKFFRHMETAMMEYR